MNQIYPPEIADRARALRAQGLTYDEIADELGISSATAYRYGNPERNRQYVQQHAAYRRSLAGVCVRCNALTNYNPRYRGQVARYCRSCASALIAESKRGKGPTVQAVLAAVAPDRSPTEIAREANINVPLARVTLTKLLNYGMIRRVAYGRYERVEP